MAIFPYENTMNEKNAIKNVEKTMTNEKRYFQLDLFMTELAFESHTWVNIPHDHRLSKPQIFQCRLYSNNHTRYFPI